MKKFKDYLQAIKTIDSITDPFEKIHSIKIDYDVYKNPARLFRQLKIDKKCKCSLIKSENYTRLTSYNIEIEVSPRFTLYIKLVRHSQDKMLYSVFVDDIVENDV